MSEAKKGISSPNKGNKLSDETRKKMSEAYQRRKMLKQLQPDGCFPLW